MADSLRLPVDERAVTGGGGDASVTSVVVSGNRMTFAQTSDGANEEFEFALTRIATSQYLELAVTQAFDFENDDGTTTPGEVIIHVRLRG